MKFRPLGAEFFMRTYWWTVRHDEANRRSFKFANLPRNVTSNIFFLFWSRGVNNIWPEPRQIYVLAFDNTLMKISSPLSLQSTKSKLCASSVHVNVFSLSYVTTIFLFLIIMIKISYCMTPLISRLSYIVAKLNIHLKISPLCSYLFLNCFIRLHINISTPVYIISHARCC